MVQLLRNRLQRIKVNYRRFGLINTVKYLIQNVIVKRPVNQIKFYWKKKNYSQNIIFITSLPKSGSTWLSNMCAGLEGFDLFAPSKWNTYISEKWDDSRWDSHSHKTHTQLDPLPSTTIAAFHSRNQYEQYP